MSGLNGLSIQTLYLFLAVVYLISVFSWMLARFGREQHPKVYLTLIGAILVSNVVNMVILFYNLNDLRFIVPSIVFAAFSILLVRPKLIARYRDTVWKQ